MRRYKFINLAFIETKLVFKIPDIYLVAFALPLIVLIILNALYGQTAISVVNRSFAGISSIGVVGSGIMGLSSIISEYREQGILRRYFVTPVNPNIYLGAICLSLSVLAMISSLFVYIEFYLLLDYQIKCNLMYYILAYFYSMLSIFAIGILIASVAKNQRVANIITVLIYFPSVLLSGCTIPYDNLPYKLKIFSNILPTTHAIKIVQNVVENNTISQYFNSIIYLAFIIVICICVAPRVFKWE